MMTQYQFTFYELTPVSAINDSLSDTTRSYMTSETSCLVQIGTGTDKLNHILSYSSALTES